MSLQFIIDGYNTVRHPRFDPPGRIKDPKRALAVLIETHHLCGSSKNPVLIVFDGFSDGVEGASASHRLRIIFSGAQSADEKIKRLVENAAHPKAIVVVSDDKEIRFSVRGAGAKVVGVEEFLRHDTQASHKAAQADPAKSDLSYAQAENINKELRKLWLR